MKRELDRAIRAAGGVPGLAARLGVSPSTVYRWRRTGVPRRKSSDARDRIERYRQERRAEKAFRDEQRLTFQELMSESAELGRLPKRTRTGTRKRVGARTEGVQHVLSIERMMSAQVFERIRAWATTLTARKGWEIWQGQVRTTQYALPELGNVTAFKGYQTVGSVSQMQHPASGDFAVDVAVATPLRRSKREALDLLEGELLSIDENVHLLVLVHSVTLFNYRQRTAGERRAYQTAQRNKRKKRDAKR